MVMVDPPFEPAVKVIVAEPFPGVADNPVGAEGVVLGVTLTDEEAVPEPIALTALRYIV